LPFVPLEEVMGNRASWIFPELRLYPLETLNHARQVGLVAQFDPAGAFLRGCLVPPVKTRDFGMTPREFNRHRDTEVRWCKSGDLLRCARAVASRSVTLLHAETSIAAIG
jgi:hypothetical protein